MRPDQRSIQEENFSLPDECLGLTCLCHAVRSLIDLTTYLRVRSCGACASLPLKAVYLTLAFELVGPGTVQPGGVGALLLMVNKISTNAFDGGIMGASSVPHLRPLRASAHAQRLQIDDLR